MTDHEINERIIALRQEIIRKAGLLDRQRDKDGRTLRQQFAGIDARFEAYKVAAQEQVARLDQRIDNITAQATNAIQSLNARVTALEQARLR